MKILGVCLRPARMRLRRIFTTTSSEWAWRFSMAAMARYIAEADSYAGFGSTGKFFGYFGLVAGAVGLTGWTAIHGQLPGLKPADAADQLLIAAMMWIGCGLAAIMAVAVLGSLMLSSKSRGTVTVDDLGVTRQIGERSRMLRWVEIEGFVGTPIRGGVTLIPREGRQTIVIPRFLDDYRGCIGEIKARGVESLPASRLKRKRSWRQALLTYIGIFAFMSANNTRETHAMRLVGLLAFAGYSVWLMVFEDLDLEDYGWIRWVSAVVLVAILAWLLWHLIHTW
jgi:hypothetical protein